MYTLNTEFRHHKILSTFGRTVYAREFTNTEGIVYCLKHYKNHDGADSKNCLN